MVPTSTILRLGKRNLFSVKRNADAQKTLEESRRLAILCASRGKWIESRDLWEICYKIDSSSSNMVNYLEASRLAGTLDIEGFPKTVTLETIIEALTPQHSSHLVADYIRMSNWNPKNDKILDRFGLKNLPEVLQAKAESKIKLSKSKRRHEDILEVDSIWNCTNTHVDFSDMYSANIPQLNIINELSVQQPNQMVDVRAARVQTISNFKSVIGSDLIQSSDGFYGDLVSWQGVQGVNFVNDSWVLAASNSEVILRQSGTLQAEAVSLKKACWLGYPMSTSWGHWVPDLLTRISYFALMGLLSATQVVVAKETPAKFLKFAELLWPEISWIKLSTNTPVEIETCFLSPARTFSVPNMHWDAYGIEQRCITEPENFKLLRQYAFAALQRNATAESPVTPGTKIMLDRSLSLYRRSRNAQFFRDLANSFDFEVLDPGAFSPLEQMQIFRNASSFFGADGSQWLWSILADEGTTSTIVGHDYSTDSRGRSWTIGSILCKEPSWVLGLRDFPGPGYSEKFYHQDYSLSEQDVFVLKNHLSSNK